MSFLIYTHREHNNHPTATNNNGKKANGRGRKFIYVGEIADGCNYEARLSYPDSTKRVRVQLYARGEHNHDLREN